MTSSPTVEILDVTPELAETWLSRNPNNRNLRKTVVDSYARDMAAGDWQLNGETIKLATDGTLMDGQHRCRAVVQADVTVPMIVVRGLPATVMPTVDVGAKRTYADALKLQGEDNTSVLAAVTRRALLWDRGQRIKSSSVMPTSLEMNAFIVEHPGLRTSADVAQSLANKSLLPASIIGLCHYLFSELAPDDAGWFLARLADGDGLSSEDPIALLRDRIVRLRVSGRRLNETEAVALAIVAWNAYRAGGTRSKLQLPKGGLTQKNFPEPR